MNNNTYVKRIISFQWNACRHEILLFEARNTDQLLKLMSDLAHRPVSLSDIPLPEVQDGLPEGKKALFALSSKDWVVATPEEPIDEAGFLQITATRTNRPKTSAFLRVVDNFPLKYKLEVIDPFLPDLDQRSASPLQPIQPQGLTQ